MMNTDEDGEKDQDCQGGSHPKMEVKSKTNRRNGNRYYRCRICGKRMRSDKIVRHAIVHRDTLSTRVGRDRDTDSELIRCLLCNCNMVYNNLAKHLKIHGNILKLSDNSDHPILDVKGCHGYAANVHHLNKNECVKEMDGNIKHLAAVIQPEEYNKNAEISHPRWVIDRIEGTDCHWPRLVSSPLVEMNKGL